jgi:hypothetical protein
LSRFRVLTDYQTHKKLIEPLLVKMGKQLPAEGNAVYFVEFNEAGEVVAFQGLQNALFFEGLCSVDKHAHLRSLWNFALEWVKENASKGEVFTMAADEKVVRAAKAMGCEELPWKVLRRKV